jgi:hypothetical protein
MLMVDELAVFFWLRVILALSFTIVISDLCDGYVIVIAIGPNHATIRSFGYLLCPQVPSQHEFPDFSWSSSLSFQFISRLPDSLLLTVAIMSTRSNK